MHNRSYSTAGCGLLAATLIIFAVAPRADAYCLPQIQGYDGYSAWEGEVPYHVSDTVTDAAVLAAIDAAFQTWAAVKCSTLSFKKGPAFKIADEPFQNPTKGGIYIFWYTEAEKASFPTDPKFVSYTFFGIDGQGAINQGSIAVNGFKADAPWGTDGSAAVIDVQAHMTALVGQVIGLNQSNVPDSVMTNTVSFGDTGKRTLKQDDIDAVSYLYADAGCPDPPAPGADGCSGTAPAPDGGTTPPADGGTTPPPADGGTTPPPADGGTTPPPADGGTTTPPADGGTTTPPTPGTCTSSAQCAEGEVCTAEGVCVGRDGGEDDSGCCAVASARPRPLTVLLTLGFVAWFLLRRRRRR